MYSKVISAFPFFFSGVINNSYICGFTTCPWCQPGVNHQLDGHRAAVFVQVPISTSPLTLEAFLLLEEQRKAQVAEVLQETGHGKTWGAFFFFFSVGLERPAFARRFLQIRGSIGKMEAIEWEGSDFFMLRLILFDLLYGTLTIIDLNSVLVWIGNYTMTPGEFQLSPQQKKRGKLSCESKSWKRIRFHPSRRLGCL